MALRFYNTLTRKKELFRPWRKNRVNLFVCGPTVYDKSHVGHARTYIIFDVLSRFLSHQGYKVFYLQNITDIDDKIINRANRLKKDPLHLARQETRAYFVDMQALGIRSVSKYAPASKFIKEIISQVKRLVKKGYAYQTAGGVYFSVPKFKDYGKLSHQNIAQIRKAVRIEKDPNKKYPADFVLWKSAKPGEPKWKSPFGPGRPGWHIEDTAIAEKYFGQQYDLHGGALDLIFPHHESEIAQMEAISGKKPAVKIWLHTGFLTIRGTKMAKSLGNFVTIREMLKKYRPEDFRMLVLQTHYRSPIDYEDRLMEQAKAAVDRLVEFRGKLIPIKNKKGKRETHNIKSKTIVLLKKVQKRFFEYLEDDFNTPKALAVVFELVRKNNPKIDAGTMSKAEAKMIDKFLKEIDSILGILPKIKKEKIPQKIMQLLEEREKLRQQKRFVEADKIRTKIRSLGYAIEDADQGYRIKRIN